MHPLLADLSWADEGDAAVELLRDLLRIDTSNPPGNETACAEAVAEHLRGSGLEPEVLEAAPGRGNVVARMRGQSDDPPLLLTAHLDVVGVEPAAWTHPPFGGEIADGFVWGRGAVDMKNMLAMSLAVLRLLADAEVPLRRDVIFAGVADEEAGCAHGSQWLVEQHPDKVRAGFALGEVGGFTMWVGGRPIYPVQVAEKGVCWIRATARGVAGHGSIPREDNAIVALAAFLQRVGRRKLPVHRSEVVDRFVLALADAQPQPARAILPFLLDGRVSPLIGKLIPDRSTGRVLEALIRNTASPVMISGGSKSNVIPSTAQAQLDGRIAVGSSADELLAELRALAGDAVELEVLLSRDPHEAPADTDLFDLIRTVVAEHHPGATAVPSVIPGFTDAHYWSQLGTVCYGFSPVRLEPDAPDFSALFHATDERVPVDGFTAGLQMLADVVFRFVT